MKLKSVRGLPKHQASNLLWFGKNKRNGYGVVTKSGEFLQAFKSGMTGTILFKFGM